MIDSVRLDLLGPLAVWRRGRLVDGGPVRQRAVLAALALRANQLATANYLLDAVWGPDRPDSGAKVIPPYIYRIRSLLPAGVLETVRQGYVLHLDPGGLDLDRFEATVRSAQVAGGDAEAARLYADALGLCRGEPLEDLPGLAAQRRRLTERVAEVLACRLDADLRCGRHTEVVAELTALVHDRPYDERLTGQLMLALYRSGRRQQALETYGRTRAALIDEFGTEPGPELRRVHHQVLAESAAGRRDELPYHDPVLVGRDQVIADIETALRAVRPTASVVAIDGMAGVGKTALAVSAARTLAGDYPEGTLFLDLHGHTLGKRALSVEAALAHLLVSVGVQADRIPRDAGQAAALWRTESSKGRYLVVLDNAADSRVVEPLIPSAAGCGVLITSRSQLTGIDPARRIAADVLDRRDARLMLAELIGDARAGGQSGAADQLVARCGCLPLAIRLAAARLRHRPGWSLGDFLERLAAVDHWLTELELDGRGVIREFSLSYEQLTEPQQRTFRLLGLIPGQDVDLPAVAALAGTTLQQVRPLLEELVNANLVDQPVMDRFRLHDLIRQYARELVAADEPDADRDAARTRLLSYYLYGVDRAMVFLSANQYLDLDAIPPGYSPAIESATAAARWTKAEQENLVAAVDTASSAGLDELAWMLSIGAAWQLHLSGQLHERDRILDAGLAAAERAAAPEGEARLLHLRGRISLVHDGVEVSLAHLRRALDVLPHGADPAVRGHLMAALGYSTVRRQPGANWRESLAEALRLVRRVDRPRTLASVLVTNAMLAGNELDWVTASRCYQEALEIKRTLGEIGSQADILNGIAECELAFGRPSAAIEAVTAAQEAAALSGARYTSAYSLCFLGSAHLQLGRSELAVQTHEQAVRAAVDSRSAHAEQIARLRLATSLLGDSRRDASREQLDRVLDARPAEGVDLTAAKALAGVARCAAAGGDLVEARRLSDFAIERLGSGRPAHAADFHRQRGEWSAQEPAEQT